jgi:DivIVA domain-containing protein
VSQQGQRFRRRALRRGYKVDEVDDFLDRVEATMTGRPLGEPVRARDVHDFVFRVRFGGYDEWQVDMHLDRVERELTALEESGGMPSAAPAPLTAGHDSFALPPADPHLGLGPRDEPMRGQRDDEPTMVRPARAAASVPQPDPGMPAAGSAQVRPGPMPSPGPVPVASAPVAGRATPSPHSSEPPATDFTQKLPPVSQGFEPTEYPAASHREPTPTQYGSEQRYEPDQQRYEAPAPSPRYEPEPRRYAPEAPRFEPQRGYAPEPPGFEPEPRRYEPEPPRFGAAPAAPPSPPDPRGRPEPTSYGSGTRYETGFEPGRHGKVDMTTEIPAADSPFTPEDLHRVDQMRRTFQERRFGSGYDPAQVNRLFDAIVATMSGRSTVQVSDGELDPAQFSLVTGGFYETEVDGALRDVREIFARRGISLSH